MPQLIYDLKGYPQFVYTAQDFAERKQPKPEQLANLLIRSIFEDGGLGRVLSIDEVTPGTPANGWTIRFTGETNGRTADPYIATYDGKAISYNDDPSRQSRDLSEGLELEFAAKKGGKNCSKGKPCGGGCIAKGRNCLKDKKDLSKNQQQAADSLAKAKPPKQVKPEPKTRSIEQSPKLSKLSGEDSEANQKKIEKKLAEWRKISQEIDPPRDVDKVGRALSTYFGANPQNFRAVLDSKGRMQAAAEIRQEQDHLYIELLGTAPWNVGSGGGREPSTDSRATKGAGREMMRQIVVESYKKGFKGDVRLESLNDAVGFYKKVGFSILPGEAEDDQPKMRLTPANARRFLEATGGIPTEIEGLM